MSPSEVHAYVNSLRYMFSFIEVYSHISLLVSHRLAATVIDGKIAG